MRAFIYRHDGNDPPWFSDAIRAGKAGTFPDCSVYLNGKGEVPPGHWIIKFAGCLYSCKPDGIIGRIIGKVEV